MEFIVIPISPGHGISPVTENKSIIIKIKKNLTSKELCYMRPSITTTTTTTTTTHTIENIQQLKRLVRFFHPRHNGQ